MKRSIAIACTLILNTSCALFPQGQSGVAPQSGGPPQSSAAPQTGSDATRRTYSGRILVPPSAVMAGEPASYRIQGEALPLIPLANAILALYPPDLAATVAGAGLAHATLKDAYSRLKLPWYKKLFDKRSNCSVRAGGHWKFSGCATVAGQKPGFDNWLSYEFIPIRDLVAEIYPEVYPAYEKVYLAAYELYKVFPGTDQESDIKKAEKQIEAMLSALDGFVKAFRTLSDGTADSEGAWHVSVHSDRYLPRFAIFAQRKFQARASLPDFLPGIAPRPSSGALSLAEAGAEALRSGRVVALAQPSFPSTDTVGVEGGESGQCCATGPAVVLALVDPDRPSRVSPASTALFHALPLAKLKGLSSATLSELALSIESKMTSADALAALTGPTAAARVLGYVAGRDPEVLSAIGQALGGEAAQFVKVPQPTEVAIVNGGPTTLFLPGPDPAKEINPTAVKLTATVYDRDGTTFTGVTWSSEDAGIARVDPGGLVSAAAPGSTLIKATALDGKTSSFVEVTVRSGGKADVIVQ